MERLELLGLADAWGYARFRGALMKVVKDVPDS